MIHKICAVVDPITKWLNWLIQGAKKNFWQNKYLLIILCGSCCIWSSHLSYPSHLLTTDLKFTYFLTVLVQSNNRLVVSPHLKLLFELCLSFTHSVCTDNDLRTRNKRIFYQADFNFSFNFSLGKAFNKQCYISISENVDESKLILGVFFGDRQD